MEGKFTSLIERIPVENEGIRVLEKVMHTYVDRWDASTVETLLSDSLNLEDQTLPGNLRRRLQFVKENLLFPLAKILASEKDKIDRERQMLVHKEQAFVSTVHSLQEERNSAVQQFQEESDLLAGQSMFVETLLRDFDEMAQAVRAYRKDVKTLQHLLIDKELEVQQLLADKQELVRIAMVNGPKAVFEWFKRDLQEQGQEVAENLEEQWLSWQPSSEAVMGKLVEGMAVTCAGSHNELSASQISIYPSEQKFSGPTSGIDQKSSILQILLLGIWREALSSLNLVIDNGVSSIPFAVVDFWTGLLGYMTDHVYETTAIKVSESQPGHTFSLLRRFIDKS